MLFLYTFRIIEPDERPGNQSGKRGGAGAKHRAGRTGARQGYRKYPPKRVIAQKVRREKSVYESESGSENSK